MPLPILTFTNKPEVTYKPSSPALPVSPTHSRATTRSKPQPHTHPHTTAYPTSTYTLLTMSTAEASGESSQKIKITTSDSIDMEVDRQVAERSILIKNLLEDLGGDNEESIPIPNVCPSPPTTLMITR